MADMEILQINAGFLLRKKSSRRKTRLPAEVIALLTPEAQAKHIAETDDPMEVDEPAAHPGLNPNDVNVDVDDGLDDLVFVIPDNEGGEQVLHLQNDAMEVDVGVGDLVINVNEAGDFNVEQPSAQSRSGKK